MDALFIGQQYTDITIIADEFPTGNTKISAEDYAFCVGGNAVVAGFCAAKFGLRPDLITQVASDRLGDTFLKRAGQAGVRVFPRACKRSSISIIHPCNGERAILSSRDTDYLEGMPHIDIMRYKALHLDGHMQSTALHYARRAKESGVLTSLDAGNLKPSIEGLLPFMNVVVASEDFAADLGKTPGEVIRYIASHGVEIAGITLGSEGMLYLENGQERHIPAIYVEPDLVVDTTGAGDIFHGAYLTAALLNIGDHWADYFNFARCASALAIQKLGAESSIPKVGEVMNLYKRTPL